MPKGKRERIITANIKIPALCPECLIELPKPREGWVRNGKYDTGGHYVTCDKCGAQLVQVIDVPNFYSGEGDETGEIYEG